MEPNNTSINNRMKIIDRIITAYKAKKLMLQAQQVQQDNVKEEKSAPFKDIRDRMENGYKRMKRQKKIEKLIANNSHWKGLN